MRNLKVLYSPLPLSAVEQKNSLLSEQLAREFNLRKFDRSTAPDSQFDDIEVGGG